MFPKKRNLLWKRLKCFHFSCIANLAHKIIFSVKHAFKNSSMFWKSVCVCVVVVFSQITYHFHSGWFSFTVWKYIFSFSCTSILCSCTSFYATNAVSKGNILHTRSEAWQIVGKGTAAFTRRKKITTTKQKRKKQCEIFNGGGSIAIQIKIVLSEYN